MIEEKASELPRGWKMQLLGDIAEINPPLDRCIIDDAMPVTFVPMRAVEPEGGGLVRPETRPYHEVKTGYTSFLTGDVIMAKITPCMENGKTAVVPEVPGGVCFGSTEFHVIRPRHGIVPHWISRFLLQHKVRGLAQRQMTGAVGQMRVPTAFLESTPIPIAPTAEQVRIADAVDELFSDLDAGVTSLMRVRDKLRAYRGAVLKAAVDGMLSVEWRAKNSNIEPATDLLDRILLERRHLWEEERLAKFKAKGHAPPRNWKAKYREPVAPDTANLPALPKTWCWTTIDQLIVAPIMNGLSVRGRDDPPGIPALRLSAMTANGFNYAAKRYLPVAATDVEDLWISRGEFFVSRGNGSKHLVGRGTLAQEPPENVIFPDTMMRLRFNTQQISLPWISRLWASGIVRRQIERSVKTTAGIWKIAQPELAAITIPLLPLAEQSAILESLEDQFSVIDHVEGDVQAKLLSAQSLRQSILRRAFTGHLVPQDQTDEPASELLKRIAVDREVQRPRPSRRPQRQQSTRTGRSI